jgi:hypothetical protein
MDFGALRSLVRELNFSAHGVDAIVTRPFPDATPITTRAIWVTPQTEDALNGTELQRREPRRVMALRKDEVPTVPRGTVIIAPPQGGESDARWRIDGIDRVEADHVRVIVVPDPEPY